MQETPLVENSSAHGRMLVVIGSRGCARTCRQSKGHGCMGDQNPATVQRKEELQVEYSLTFSWGSVDGGSILSLAYLPTLGLPRAAGLDLLLVATPAKSPRSRFFRRLFLRAWAKMDRGDLGVIALLPRMVLPRFNLLVAPDRGTFFGVRDITRKS